MDPWEVFGRQQLVPINSMWEGTGTCVHGSPSVATTGTHTHSVPTWNLYLQQATASHKYRPLNKLLRNAQNTCEGGDGAAKPKGGSARVPGDH